MTDAERRHIPFAWKRYALVCACMGLAVLIRLCLDNVVGDYILAGLVPVIIVSSAVFGGLGPGLFATGLNTALIAVALHSDLPGHISLPHPRHLLHIVPSVLAFFLISILAELMRRSVRIAERAAADLRRQELELRSSEERYRTLFSAMNEGFALCEIVHDAGGRADYRFLEVNPAFEVLAGVGAGTAIGKTVRQVIPGAQAWLDRYAGVVQEQPAAPPPSCIRIDDRWCEVFVFSPGRGRIATLLVDVSDRKQAEEELRVSQERLATLSAASLEGIAMSEHGRIIDANEQYAKMYGYSLPEIIGMEVSRLVAPQDRSRVCSMLHSNLERSGEYLNVRKDGAVFPVEASSRILAMDGRRIRITSIRDLTRRKTNERTIRESEERFRLAADASGAMIYDLDLATARVRLVHGLDRLLGYNGAELPHLTRGWWIEQIHPDDREAALQATSRALEGGQDFRLSYRIQHKGGHYLTVEDTGRVVRGESGRAIRLVGGVVDVTERKRMEAALIRHDELLQGIIDGIPVMIAICDPAEKTLVLNNAFRQTLGWSDDLSTDELMARCHPDPQQRQAVLEHMASLRPGWCDFKVTTSSGELVDSSWSFMQLSDGRRVAIGIDIRERKQAEEALRASEERYRQIIESTHEGVWVIDIEGVTAYVNDQMAEILGCRPEEMIGTSTFDYIYAEDLSTARENFESTLRGDFVQREFRFRRRDGREAWLLVNPSPIRNAAGAITGLLGMFTDITARRSAENAVREGERRLRLALESGRMGTWDWTVGSQRVEWSEGHYTLLGYRVGEIEPCYRAFRRRVHPADQRRQEQAIRWAMRQRKEYACEFRVVWPDGAVHWLEARGRFVYDEQGKAVRMYGVLIDIDEKRRYEEALAAAKETAEAANSAKDHFLAVLSHELRTPLTPVLITASALEGDTSLSPSVREDMLLIRRSIELEVRLINDLLDVNRISHGKLQVCVENVDAHTSLTAALDICRSEAHQKRLEITCELKAENSRTMADSSRLQQVFWNLLKNAVKFTTPCGRIRLRSWNPSPDRLNIEVSDTGIGIEPQALPGLFNAFEQGGDQITRQFGGLGLGLAISKALIEMLGGTIWAHSAGPGQGATFTVELPTAPQPEAGEFPATPLAEDMPRLRILLVEDHPTTALVVARVLTNLGHEVRTASDVRGALDLAGTWVFDLLISDLGLPDGTGVDVLQTLRGTLPKLPAIALSGYGMDSDIAATRRAGFADHLTKPVDTDLLRRAILQALLLDRGLQAQTVLDAENEAIPPAEHGGSNGKREMRRGDEEGERDS